MNVLTARAWRGVRGLLFCAVAGTSACGSGSDTLRAIPERGFVRAGYAEEPPYAYLDSSGTVEGEAAVALRGALFALGVDSVRWVRFDFEDLIPELHAGRVDVVAAGLFVTDERARRVAFTSPSACARATLVSLVGSPPVVGLEDFLTGPGGRLVVLGGSVESEAARTLGIPADRLLVVPDLRTGVAAIRRGGGRALALTLPSARRLADADAELQWYPYEPPPAVASLVRGCSALAVRTADQPLLRALNMGLAEFVGSPSHVLALERLGFERADLPSDVQAGP